MKRLAMMVALLATMTLGTMAQTPWKIVDMEQVNRHGGNCDYDDETCTATFKEKWDRWFDLPEVSGDLTQHTKLNLTIKKSTCMLKVVVRYKDADGKQQQVDAATFYRQMGKSIDKDTKITCDLTNKGKIGEDILKNVTSIRISMAKAVDGNEAPWETQFGEVTIQ
ncbi:MAG: hypothetical protein J6M40_03055 [Prevotella sp.]|nr:hypothetical protein [Prevotella sp.]